jgi:ribA/ribD-fused uncharacterized protein
MATRRPSIMKTTNKNSAFPFSNFEVIPGGIQYGAGDLMFSTVEHAFQAMKTTDPIWRERVRMAATPSLAKRLGRKVPLRADWEQVKTKIMKTLLRMKFRSEPFRTRLLTFEGPIVEINTWHDQTWGDCVCGKARCQKPGLNLLGHLLEEVRNELQGDGAAQAGSGAE